MNHRSLIATWMVGALVLACSDNPTGPGQEQLTVNLSLSTDHLSILEELTFTVTVTNQNGAPVTDFTALAVEYLREGSDTWRATEMTLQGTSYVGTRTFTTSGDHHFRVTGMRGTETEMQVLYEDPMHYEIERAHTTVGAFRVEFESFPGHIHEGDNPTLSFWIMDDATQAAVTGMTVTIECGNPDGSTELHTVIDNLDGVYDAEHLFAEAGDAYALIRFNDPGNVEREAEFHLHVAHAH